MNKKTGLWVKEVKLVTAMSKFSVFLRATLFALIFYGPAAFVKGHGSCVLLAGGTEVTLTKMCFDKLLHIRTYIIHKCSLVAAFTFLLPYSDPRDKGMPLPCCATLFNPRLINMGRSLFSTPRCLCMGVRNSVAMPLTQIFWVFRKSF